jgi:hypothetical protein
MLFEPPVMLDPHLVEPRCEESSPHGRRVLVARHRVRQAFERVIYVEVSVDGVTDQGEVGCRTTAITAAPDQVAF